MQLTFNKVPRNFTLPASAINSVFLKIDHWNDYSFVTMFEVIAYDETGQQHTLPNIKIGFVGQTISTDTHTTLPDSFTHLPEGYFSLGTDVSFYQYLAENMSAEWAASFLEALYDVVYKDEILEYAKNERVFQTSHLRSVPLTSLKEQFRRALKGYAPTTDFDFHFILPESETFAGFDLEFNVAAESKPSTNIHALIGRNGVGKTTVLNHMVKAISDHELSEAQFYKDTPAGRHDLRDGFFSNLISVAFSVFDPFDLPPADRPAHTGTPYSYIGLTDYADESGAIIKSQEQLYNEFTRSIDFCLSEPARKNRWEQAVKSLESDGNFSDMDLCKLTQYKGEELEEASLKILRKMSSGHAITIITLTQLVEKVGEKTLVLFDEPETHLHPPLLSAFVRALSQLLYRQNGVAIIATHSPVVLQEIPKSCVWKMFRKRKSSRTKRPQTETFGENVGTLTREIFGLEVEKSGFHTVLEAAVKEGKDYDQIMSDFGGCLGYEAKGILRAMVLNRDTAQ